MHITGEWYINGEKKTGEIFIRKTIDITIIFEG